MKIRCWGSRGSIPVSGKEYNKYGGDTTCLEIRTRDDRIIIVDAGTGIRKLGLSLVKEGRYSYDMLFTHAHWDHLMGFPFFSPIYNEKTGITMQGCPFAQKFIETMLGKVMAPPNFPVNYNDIKAHLSYIPDCPMCIEIGTVSIIPISLSHPNQGNGYKFIEDGNTFVFLTDNELDFQHRGGLSFDEYREFVRDADLLIHDGEYTREEYKTTRQWGHSVYTTALDLAMKAGVKRLGLFHINQGRSDQEVDQMVERCNEIIEENKSDLECFAVGADMIFDV